MTECRTSLHQQGQIVFNTMTLQLSGLPCATVILPSSLINFSWQLRNLRSLGLTSINSAFHGIAFRQRTSRINIEFIIKSFYDHKSIDYSYRNCKLTPDFGRSSIWFRKKRQTKHTFLLHCCRCWLWVVRLLSERERDQRWIPTFSVTHAKKVVKMVTLLWWQNQSLRELAATAEIIAGCLSLEIFHLKKDLSSEESH